MCFVLAILTALIFVFSHAAEGVEHVVLNRARKQHFVSGRVVIEAQDGGLLLQAADGFLWAVQSTELVKRSEDEASFQPKSKTELSTDLLTELSSEFQVHTTAHYVVCHNTSRQYAQWCGALYERLYRAFHNYWKRRGLKLHEPEFPLVSLVFKDKISYEAYAASELGEATRSIIGYYSLRTNRVTMYDLTGLDALRTSSARPLTLTEINRSLARPETERTVATIIHEATHQIAFNCGLHHRFADIPLWVSEGIAMYFETPDLKSSRGWRNIGGVNRVRLNEFRTYLADRHPNSLESLIGDDVRFKDPKSAIQSYPESWAFVYFLIRNRPKEFIRYLHRLSKKQPLMTDDPASRLKDFQNVFGSDLLKLDESFIRQMSRIR